MFRTDAIFLPNIFNPWLIESVGLESRDMKERLYSMYGRHFIHRALLLDAKHILHDSNFTDYKYCITYAKNVIG